MCSSRSCVPSCRTASPPEVRLLPVKPHSWGYTSHGSAMSTALTPRTGSHPEFLCLPPWHVMIGKRVSLGPGLRQVMPEG